VRANALARLVGIIDAIDPPPTTGRPRVWSTLIMLQALWWIARSGAAWRFLPAGYPPRQSVDSRLGRWVSHGVLDRALALLNGCIRWAKGRNRRPSAGIVDTQAVRTGPQAGPRGFDASKKVKGRKRVLLVDTQGLIHGLRVIPASVQDRDALATVEPELTAAGRMTKLWADLGFNGDAPVAVAARVGVDLELVGRRHKAGFELDPRRWIVEQDFGKLGRYRRLAVDHEGSLGTSRTMTLIAAVFMTANAFERIVMA
jgi:putative transposase